MAVHDHQATLAARIFLAQFDISGDLNAHGIQQSVNLPVDSSYGDTFTQRKIGIRDMGFSIAGFMDLSSATDTDTALTGALAVANRPLIIASHGVAIGDPCEFGLVNEASYSPKVQQGDVYKFDVAGNIASRRWVRGAVLWSPTTATTGTSNGTEVNLGAVSATQKLYTAICIYSATALVSFTIKVQSDTTGFPSSADRVTFTTAAGVTSEMPAPVDGPITDTFWRVAVTAFSGTSASIIVVAGIA